MSRALTLRPKPPVEELRDATLVLDRSHLGAADVSGARNLPDLLVSTRHYVEGPVGGLLGRLAALSVNEEGRGLDDDLAELEAVTDDTARAKPNPRRGARQTQDSPKRNPSPRLSPDDGEHVFGVCVHRAWGASDSDDASEDRNRPFRCPRANQPRSKRVCSSAVRSAVGTASSRASGMASPLSMERP